MVSAVVLSRNVFRFGYDSFFLSANKYTPYWLRSFSEPFTRPHDSSHLPSTYKIVRVKFSSPAESPNRSKIMGRSSVPSRKSSIQDNVSSKFSSHATSCKSDPYNIDGRTRVAVKVQIHFQSLVPLECLRTHYIHIFSLDYVTIFTYHRIHCQCHVIRVFPYPLCLSAFHRWTVSIVTDKDSFTASLLSLHYAGRKTISNDSIIMRIVVIISWLNMSFIPAWMGYKFGICRFLWRSNSFASGLILFTFKYETFRANTHWFPPWEVERQFRQCTSYFKRRHVGTCDNIYSPKIHLNSLLWHND